MERDWKLLEKLSRLGDGVLVNVTEAACVTGFSPFSIQQKKVKNFPKPISNGRSLRWTLGQLRTWGGETNSSTAVVQLPVEDLTKPHTKKTSSPGRPRLLASNAICSSEHQNSPHTGAAKATPISVKGER